MPSISATPPHLTPTSPPPYEPFIPTLSRVESHSHFSFPSTLPNPILYPFSPNIKLLSSSDPKFTSKLVHLVSFRAGLDMNHHQAPVFRVMIPVTGHPPYIFYIHFALPNPPSRTTSFKRSIVDILLNTNSDVG
jgi:hypothetical protein